MGAIAEAGDKIAQATGQTAEKIQENTKQSASNKIIEKTQQQQAQQNANNSVSQQTSVGEKGSRVSSPAPQTNKWPREWIIGSDGKSLSELDRIIKSGPKAMLNQDQKDQGQLLALQARKDLSFSQHAFVGRAELSQKMTIDDYFGLSKTNNKEYNQEVTSWVNSLSSEQKANLVNHIDQSNQKAATMKAEADYYNSKAPQMRSIETQETQRKIVDYVHKELVYTIWDDKGYPVKRKTVEFYPRVTATSQLENIKQTLFNTVGAILWDVEGDVSTSTTSYKGPKSRGSENQIQADRKLDMLVTALQKEPPRYRAGHNCRTVVDILEVYGTGTGKDDLRLAEMLYGDHFPLFPFLVETTPKE